MRKLISAGLLLCVFCNANAQDSVRRFKQMIFAATVFENNKVISNTYLVQVNDTSIGLSDRPHAYGLPAVNPGSLNYINYSNIDQINLRRKGEVGRGILTGVIAGAALGAIIGFASGDDKAEGFQIFRMTAGEKAMGLGLMGGLLGGVTGGIIGAVATKKFYINRSPTALKELNTSLLERVYVR